jgi:hypothetical protein
MFGRQLFGGGKIKYYRQHAIPLMQSHSRDIGLYGSEKAKWESDPIINPFKALFDEEFKYRWEREHYYDRPYGETGTFGEDIPFLGPLIAGTIGRVIKPARPMHTEEFLATSRQGEAAYLSIPTSGSHEPSYELGGLPPGIPVSKHGPSQTAGEQIYRLGELIGLPGFTLSAVKEAITGSQDWWDKDVQMESARRAFGNERWYWEKQLGDHNRSL